MCEPITLAAAGVALAGTAVSTVGQIRSGNYQQAIAEQNAQLQEKQAALAEQRGAYEAGVQRMKGSEQIGTARTEMAASGLDISSGSALDVISDSRMMNELDAQTIKNNAAREAWGYRVGAVQSRAQGELAQTASRYGAASTLLGGVAQIGSTALDVRRRSMGLGTTAGSLSPAG